MNNIITVSELSKQFKQITAVNQLSFSIEQGDVYGFLGQNGAGKSTTIRMLLSLIKPTTGTIEIFGLNLQSHRKEILQQVGSVIEKPDVYNYLSALQNLQLFAKLSSIQLTRKMLMQQLERVGLAQRANDTVKTFSQGMKQRLGIAIALVHNPTLIILDEPTNGLDPQGIADIRNLILHLSKEDKKNILVSSHLLNEIEQIASKVLIIDKGRKIIEGTASDLFDPSQTIVELSTIDNDAAWNWLLQSEWSKYLLKKSKESFSLKLNKIHIPQLNAALVKAELGVITIYPKNSLENYFLQVTSENQHVEAFSN